MPKKPKLYDLLCEFDSDFLTEIITTIVSTSPEIEDRIRIIITPKNQISNPISYYKKQLKGIPATLNNKSKIKLLKSIVDKLLVTIQDLNKSKNFNESSKAYQAILETLIPKSKNYNSTDLQKYFESIIDSWCKSIENIPNAQDQSVALSFLTEGRNNKVFEVSKEESYYMDFDKLAKAELAIGSVYYLFFERCCLVFRNPCILEELESIISKNQSYTDEYMMSKVYLLKSQGKIKEFYDLVSRYPKYWEFASTLIDYFFETGETKLALLSYYNYIESNAQNGFDVKNGTPYKNSLKFLELCTKYPEHVDQVWIQITMILVICTGSNQWAYDVSPSAPWWNYYNELKSQFPTNWSMNYTNIIEILSSKGLKEQLFAILTYEKDIGNILNYFGDTKDIDMGLDVALAVYRIEPELALDKIIKFVRYREFYFYQNIETAIRSVLGELNELIPANRLNDLTKVIKKMDSSKSENRWY
jgi:hypothetical protein